MRVGGSRAHWAVRILECATPRDASPVALKQWTGCGSETGFSVDSQSRCGRLCGQLTTPLDMPSTSDGTIDSAVYAVSPMLLPILCILHWLLLTTLRSRKVSPRTSKSSAHALLGSEACQSHHRPQPQAEQKSARVLQQDMRARQSGRTSVFGPLRPAGMLGV